MILEQNKFDKHPSIEAYATIAADIAGKANPQKIEKWWGHELVYKNDPQYCIKMLHLNPDGASSRHFHVDKHETLLVVRGTLTLEYTFR